MGADEPGQHNDCHRSRRGNQRSMRHDPRQLAVMERPAASVSNHNRAGAGADAVVFEHVSLAFDDNVVLRDVSFSVPAVT